MEKYILDRYNSPQGAASYYGKFERHWAERLNNRREQYLVRRLLGQIPETDRVGLALDMPCGYGRLFPLVREVMPRVVEGDWSYHLLRTAQEYLKERKEAGTPQGFVRGTALAMPFASNAFDLVLSVRLSHHISTMDERHQHVRELLRISRKWVLFTYFDTNSLKNVVHGFKRRFVPKREKWTLSAVDVANLAAEAGFEIVSSVPLSRLFSGHNYVTLRRSSSGGA
jgi:SAM-dependent methyltransferase